MSIRVSQQPRATRTSIPSGCARSWETSGCTRKLSFLSHEPSSIKRGKGRRDRRQGGRSAPLLDGKEFHGRRAARKLREFFRQEVRAELRAVAALNNVELITALISFNWQLASAADSQRGGFAADYPGRKHGVGRISERTE
jgi:hypothetical protein